MPMLNEAAAQAWNDPAELAEQLAQQPGLKTSREYALPFKIDIQESLDKSPGICKKI